MELPINYEALEDWQRVSDIEVVSMLEVWVMKNRKTSEQAQAVLEEWFTGDPYFDKVDLFYISND